MKMSNGAQTWHLEFYDNADSFGNPLIISIIKPGVITLALGFKTHKNLNVGTTDQYVRTFAKELSWYTPSLSSQMS